jgi:hypothetical protein
VSHKIAQSSLDFRAAGSVSVSIKAEIFSTELERMRSGPRFLLPAPFGGLAVVAARDADAHARRSKWLPRSKQSDAPETVTIARALDVDPLKLMPMLLSSGKGKIPTRQAGLLRSIEMPKRSVQ